MTKRALRSRATSVNYFRRRRSMLRSLFNEHFMNEYYYIRTHFVRRSDCTYIIFYGPTRNCVVFSLEQGHHQERKVQLLCQERCTTAGNCGGRKRYLNKKTCILKLKYSIIEHNMIWGRGFWF